MSNDTTPPKLVENFILGISGKKRSGKDEVAQVVGKHFSERDKMGRNIFRFGFADALKDMYCARVGISRFELEAKKDLHRTSLQDLGEKMRVEKGDRYWIDQLAARIKSIPKEPSLVIISDVRHVNEADWILSIGGILWRVERKIAGGIPDGHISETALNAYNKWDLVIDNYLSLASLHETVAHATDKFFGNIYDKNLQQILEGQYGQPYKW